MRYSLALIMVLVFSSVVLGEETVAPTPTVEKTVIKNPALDETIIKINNQIKQVDKIVKTYDNEMSKPEDKRDIKLLQKLKINEAMTYMAASQIAKGFSVRLKGDEKQSFLDQYDKPNREKAINILLELADAALDKKEYKDAISLYQHVLQMDPKNQQAQAGIKKITEEMKTTKSGTNNNGGGTTDKTNIKDYQKGYKQDYTGTHTDWGRTGRSY
jgi:tetratricopeptide (TPR) repeat protein